MIRRNAPSFLAVACVTFAAGVALAVEATKGVSFKPGFNIFSKDEDVEMGKQAAVEVEKQDPLLQDSETLRYINRLGMRLIHYEPLPADYPWSFKVLNSRDINAFALPGGIVYVNRGSIEAAEDEAQLAGAIAHETGHVVMRHGTHTATQVVIAQVPLALLGGWLGQSSSAVSEFFQVAAGVGAESILLRNSRNSESQADTIGTYVLYHAGYDPHALAQFFVIIERKDPTRTIQFFSDHPNPENRIQAIESEIPQLGPPIQGKTDSLEFEAVKKRLLEMPSPPTKPKTEE